MGGRVRARPPGARGLTPATYRLPVIRVDRFLVGRRRPLTAAFAATPLVLPAGAEAAPPDASSGGATFDGTPVGPVSPPAGGGRARLNNGAAAAPARAPRAVKRVIRAANTIRGRPYRYGGGHRSFLDTAYDCSGAVSYALHGARLLAAPLDSGSLMRWGRPGRGRWVTVYTNPAHAYVVVAG